MEVVRQDWSVYTYPGYKDIDGRESEVWSNLEEIPSRFILFLFHIMCLTSLHACGRVKKGTCKGRHDPASLSPTDSLIPGKDRKVSDEMPWQHETADVRKSRVIKATSHSSSLGSKK